MPEVLTPSPLRLDANGTAEIAADGHGIGGYMWTAEVATGNGRVEAISTDAAAAIGGGGTARFRVRWPDKSAGKVVLHYRRPWENKDELTKEIQIVP